MLFSREDNSLHIEDMTPHHIVSCATITGSPFQYILGVYFEDQRAPTPKDNPEPSYGRVFCPSDIQHTVRISPLRSHLIFFLIIQFVCEIIMGEGHHFIHHFYYRSYLGGTFVHSRHISKNGNDEALHIILVELYSNILFFLCFNPLVTPSTLFTILVVIRRSCYAHSWNCNDLKYLPCNYYTHSPLN